jgi:outer membrane protein
MKKVLLVLLVAMPLSLMAQKFGHFNSADIIQMMPEYKNAQTELQKLQTQYENDLKAMQEEFQRKLQEYQQAADSLPENIRARREEDLTQLDNRIKQTYQQNQEDLQKTSNEKMQLIADKVREAVKAIGDAGNYVYIMDTTSGIPYISTTLSTDVTAEIKKKLGL